MRLMMKGLKSVMVMEKAVRKTYTEKANKEMAQVLQKIAKKKEYLFKESEELENWVAQIAEKHALLSITYTTVDEQYYVKRGKPMPENQRIAKKINNVSVSINTERFERIIALIGNEIIHIYDVS